MSCRATRPWSYPTRRLARLLGITNPPESLPLRREGAACLSCETAINGKPVRSVMDQHCSFPRFSTSAGFAGRLEGWHPARRSIVLHSQLSSRKMTSIHPQHCQSCGITDDHLFHGAGLWPTCQRTTNKATYQRPRLVPNQSSSWPGGPRASAPRSCRMAESDSVGQPLNPWASHLSVGSGDAGPLWIW